MMKMKVALLGLILVAVSAMGMTEKEVYKGVGGAPNGYIEFLPDAYDGVKKFPLLIWWHGLGEPGAGTDRDLDKLHKNIVLWLRANEVPFIVLVPQDANGWGKASPFAKWAIGKYPTIDLNSMHMAGLSSGGYMVRDFINEDSDVYKLFSTFTPMATNLDGAVPNARRIVENNQYVWAHAGEVDNGANMPGASARFIKALQALAPDRGMLTIYKGIGHSSWNMTYNASGKAAAEIAATTFEGAKLFKWVDEPVTWWAWMLAHAKGSPPVDPEPPLPAADSVKGVPYYENGTLVFPLKSGKKVSIPATAI